MFKGKYMKKLFRLSAVGIIFLAVFFGMCLSCFGAGTNYQQQNADVGAEKCRELDELCKEHYLKKLDGDEYSAESKTCNVIQDYVTRIKQLVYSDRAQTEDLSAEMELLCKKGVAAGRLSWIYYSHNETVALDSVSAIYRSKLAVIDSATNGAYFDNGSVESCYTDLFQIIYTEKLRALAEESDSDTVLAIINAAPSSMGSVCKYDDIASDGEDGGNYKSFYLSVVKSVTEQRRRDETAEELSLIFSILYPSESPEGSPRLSEFYNSLSTKKDIDSMNRLLLDTAETLIDGLCVSGADCRNEYLLTKKEEVKEAVSAAGGDNIASLAPLFSDHSLKIAAADAKDALSSFARELAEREGYGDSEKDRLSGIVEEFSGVGGVFDLAEDEAEIEKQLYIAKTRCTWLDAYLKAVSEIRFYLGESSDIERQAAESYAEVVDEINNGNRQGGADISSVLSDDTERLGAFVAEAEAESFRRKHRDILLKPDVGIEDRESLGLAIADGAALSEEACELLLDILLSLGEKYKEAVSEEIASLVKADGAQSERIADAERLVGAVDALSATDNGGGFDLLALKEKADSLCERAAVIAALYDSYCLEYLSGRTDRFADDAKAVAVDAAGRIADAEESEWEEIARGAVIEIIRFAALEDIYAAAEGYEEISEIAELLARSREDIKGYSDKTAIISYAEEIIAEVSELIRLEEAGRAEDSLSELAGDIGERIENYEFISDEKRSELLCALAELLSDFTQRLEAAVDKSGVLQALADGEAEFSRLENEAEKAENAACLTAVKEKLNSCFGKKEDYSSENYVRILEIINRCEAELSAVSGVAEYLAIGNRGIADILAVEDLLEEAKRLSSLRLLEEYDRLMLKKYCYSADSLSTLAQIYEHSVAELSALSAISDAPLALALAEERIALMRGVSFQKVYTEDGGLASADGYRYPEGYDLSEGYAGAVFAEGGIPSDTLLYITSADGTGIAEQIKKAAKRGRIFIGGEKVERDIMKLLRSCRVSAAVDIDLGGALAEGGAYRVSLLIPDNVDLSDVIGAVFIGKDGRVEFHPVTRGENVIEFDTTHFSKYYIVSAGSVNLTPWLICLSIIVLCQLVLAAILIVRRQKRKPKPEAPNDIPLAAFATPTVLAVRYRPAGAEMAVSVLFGVAIALGGLIAYLLIDELKYAKKKREALAEKPADKLTEISERAVCVPDIPEKAVAEMFDEPEAEPENEPMEEFASEAVDDEMLSKKAEDDLPEASEGEAPLSAVSAEEADSLMSDTEVLEIEQGGNLYEDTEIYRGTKKAEINIDTISERFPDGATVTLNSLKEMKLLPKNVGAVKILARGVLDKRLTVVAQDFSRSAVKMILLTGGEAVFTYPSSERGGNSNKKI